jgi:tripartite-type tricarboxylate transporter receptor subunit TctC
MMPKAGGFFTAILGCRHSRQALIVGATAAIFALLAPAAASAQTAYPARPVKIIVPFAAGGVADITVRIVAEKLGDRLGQRFVIENMAGAGGVTAARAALSAPPDGYTLAMLTNGTAVSVGLFKSLPFDPVKDFAPISLLGQFDFIFATNAASDLKTMDEVLKTARAKPGDLNVATIAVGSTQHLTAVLWKSEARVDFAMVPFRATPDALVALLRNDVQVLIDTYAALRSALDDKRIRAVATSGDTRSKVLPDVPTIQESGIGKFDVRSWNALFAPKGTPPEIISALNTALREVLANPDVVARLLDMGIEAQPSSPQELAGRLQADIRKWTDVIEKAGIQKQ